MPHYMEVKWKQRVGIEFLTAEGESLTVIRRRMSAVYGQACLDRRTQARRLCAISPAVDGRRQKIVQIIDKVPINWFVLNGALSGEYFCCQEFDHCKLL